ncbi:hypothetical protein FY192_02690 [Anaplasma marginale]|nr:hypothetical protein F0Q58_02170 [Anaplasma marginale]KAB0451036.1 hypothetical protein FY210_01725 [Anaplasma marginale]KAB0452395.1 hypothetical protein FY192_02690 [Anaplasma marginale]
MDDVCEVGCVYKVDCAVDCVREVDCVYKVGLVRGADCACEVVREVDCAVDCGCGVGWGGLYSPLSRGCNPAAGRFQ